MDEQLVHASDDEIEATQPSLPLDLDPDAAVPYRLTAKAVRAVAPGSLPALRIVDDGSDGDHVPADLDDPHDPRSARARALRRAGIPVAEIASELDVDEVVVRTWTSELGPRRRRPRLRAVTDTVPPRSPSRGDAARVRDQAVRERFADARASAAVSAPGRLGSADFTRGLALTVAAADIDAHAVVVTLRDRTVARTVVRWLEDHAGARPGDLRVVLRLGDVHGADLLVHRWAEALDLPVQRLSRTHWRTAPGPDAVELLIRVAAPEVAGRVAGWRDVLLGAPDLDRPDHDVAF